MSTGFVYLRPLALVCVRTHGAYATSSLAAWRQMFAWLDDSGMRRKIGCGYGLMRDNPALTAPEQCRYDACVELLAGFENTVPAGFRDARLPGGAYARQRQLGTQGLDAAITSLRDAWVPSHGLAVDRDRPFIEIYLDDPATTPVEKRRVNLCIPVGMGATLGGHTRAA